MAEIKYTFSELIVTGKPKPIKIIVLEGMLDESNADEFAPKIYEFIESMDNETSVILDLEKLTYMNSKSIGYIADYYNKVSAKNGKIVIAKPARNVKETLSVVGLDQMIPFTQTLEEAKLQA